MEQLVQQLAGLQQEDRPDDYINDFVEGSAAESSEYIVVIHVETYHFRLHQPCLCCC